MIIERIKLYYKKIPLKQPYVLSFASVTSLDCILIEITTDQNTDGVAELVPLPGYSPETRGSILSDLKGVCPELVGIALNSIEDRVASLLVSSPFSGSGIITAGEFAGNSIEIPERIEIPLIAPISASRDLHELTKKAESIYEKGYRTLKLKVGWDIEMDSRCCRVLLDQLPDDASLRIDANQGYNLEEAIQFFSALEHPRNDIVECLEQPLGIDAWDDFERLVRHPAKNVPLMLDESIVAESDVVRAGSVGADLVKLKLFKQKGIKGLISLAEKANESGMKVILGNGVSSEIGNLAEAIAYETSGTFHGAFEGNGFEKTTQRTMQKSPKVTAGQFVWERPSASNPLIGIENEDFEQISEF